MKTKYIFAVLLVLLLTSPAFAAPQKKNSKGKSSSKTMTDEEIRRYNRRRLDIHNIYVWGGGGYSGLVNNSQSFTNGINYTGDVSSKFIGGGGGLIGLGYEYNYKRFVLSVGPEFRLFSSRDTMMFSSPYQVTGLEYNQTKEYLLSHMQENQLVGQVMLPIFAGMQFNKLYWKAGVKVGYTVMGRYTQNGHVEPSIIDPDAYANWSNIPGHYNTMPEDLLHKGQNAFGLDVAVSAEIGVRLDQLLGEEWRLRNEERERPMRMRIGVFADYGVLNMSVRTDNAFAQCDANSIQTQSYHASEWGSKLNSLLVGVKFTWMLQMNKEKPEMKQNGNLNVYTFDSKTSKLLSGTAVQIVSANDGRPTKKTTGSKGTCSKRLPEGEYLISAQRSGYMSVTDMPFHHIQGVDTARLGMVPVPVYTCIVKDAKSGMNIAASLQFNDAQTGENVQVIQTADGISNITLPLGKQYVVHLEAIDHFALTKTVDDIYGQDTFLLEPIIKKRAIILHNLFFATNETTILPQSESGLQDLYDLLNENQAIRIRITGHTDNVGSDEANQILSEGRANSVRQAMIDRGIEGSRIETEGKGETEPIDTNETEEGRANNRRVEFVVL